MAVSSVHMKKHYKLVPPDGGYGYVILGCACMFFIAEGMFIVCFGMIFDNFFITLGMGSADINLLTGIFSLGIALSGYFNGPLLKLISRRQLAFVASVVFNGGCLGAVFVNSKLQFILCQGLIKGLGTGLVYDLACTFLNDYFVTKRVFCVSFATTVAAIASIIAPILIRWSNDELGFRGSLIIITGICIHTFVASALLQPVDWHMKKVEVEDIPEKTVLTPRKMSVDELQINALLQTTAIKMSDAESVDIPYNDQKRRQSAIQIVKESIISKIKNFMDWPLAKRITLTCSCLGVATCAFADFMYMNFLPQTLYALNWDKDMVSWAFALFSTGDIIARFLFILLSWKLKNQSSHSFYFFGLVIAIVTKTIMLWLHDYTTTLINITIMGASRCTIMMLFPLVISECVTSDEYPSAVGITMSTHGVMAVLFGPIIGLIRDITGSYMIMYMILISLYTIVCIAWIFEMLSNWKQERKRRHTLTRREN